MEGIREEFISDRKGQKFVRFAGVLDLAHQRGLKELASQIVQIPSAENGHLAVVIATATFEDGRVFQDVGDCSPANCAALIAVHALRMAATRAQGRAMGRALNISVALIEELADDEASNGRAAVAPSHQVSRPAIASEPGAALCVQCNKPISKNEIAFSQHHTKMNLCGEHAREKIGERTAAPATS